MVLSGGSYANGSFVIPEGYLLAGGQQVRKTALPHGSFHDMKSTGQNLKGVPAEEAILHQNIIMKLQLHGFSIIIEYVVQK